MRPRVLALTLAAVAATAVAAALVRLRRPGSAGAPGGRSATAPEPETYRCDCGQEFRVSGSGRHRVYWLAAAPEHDPVLAPQCPSCERPLPHESEAPARAAVDGAA
jgi:hypothetical protein